MINLYDYITDSRMFKKFQLDDLLFVEYHCFIEDLKSGFWTPCNYLIYILTGKKVEEPGQRILWQAGRCPFPEKRRLRSRTVPG